MANILSPSFANDINFIVAQHNNAILNWAKAKNRLDAWANRNTPLSDLEDNLRFWSNQCDYWRDMREQWISRHSYLEFIRR